MMPTKQDCVCLSPGRVKHATSIYTLYQFLLLRPPPIDRSRVLLQYQFSMHGLVGLISIYVLQAEFQIE
jgi:hypothetical protein